MGLDYSYKVLVKKGNTEKVIEFVKRHGDISNCTLGQCADIYFTLDKDITEYLEKYPRKNIEEIENKGKIGCIYIEEEEIENEEMTLISFCAASTTLSFLISDSESIQEWFLELSKEVKAILTYLDMEDFGCDLLYYEGRRYKLRLPGDMISLFTKKEFLKMLHVYTLASGWFKK